jgi:hypothetical protein
MQRHRSWKLDPVWVATWLGRREILGECDDQTAVAARRQAAGLLAYDASVSGPMENRPKRTQLVMALARQE